MQQITNKFYTFRKSCFRCCEFLWLSLNYDSLQFVVEDYSTLSRLWFYHIFYFVLSFVSLCNWNTVDYSANFVKEKTISLQLSCKLCYEWIDNDSHFENCWSERERETTNQTLKKNFPLIKERISSRNQSLRFTRDIEQQTKFHGFVQRTLTSWGPLSIFPAPVIRTNSAFFCKSSIFSPPQ